jgi:ABC-type polysaccharide/polyol phosphate export permease
MTLPLSFEKNAVQPEETGPPIAFVRRRDSIPTIIADLWGSRYLVGQFVLRDLTLRYTQAVMGVAWALLMPLLIVGAGLMFRLVVARMSGSPVEGASIVSLAAKALAWAFFSSTLATATQTIIGNSNLIGKIYFPRESLPIATVLGQCIDLSVGVVLLSAIVPFTAVSFQWSALWAPVILILLVLFTTGCALLLSCANLFYRDVKYIVQVVLNFGMFATPVFFEPQLLGRKGALIMLALPLSPFLQALDICVVRGHTLLGTTTFESTKGPITVWAPWLFGYAFASSVCVFCVGLLIFRRASSRFAEMA